MKKNYLEKIEIFNNRVYRLFEQISGWLEEEKIDFRKEEKKITLSEGPNRAYESKRLDVFTKEDEKLISVVPYGIWIIGAEGRVELEGDSGAESLVFLPEKEPDNVVREKSSAKDYIIRHQFTGNRAEGWHWLDDRITGKKPLLTKEIFLSLLERIN